MQEIITGIILLAIGVALARLNRVSASLIVWLATGVCLVGGAVAFISGIGSL